MKMILLLIQLLVLCAAASFAAEEDGFDVSRGVVYGKSDTGKDLTMIIVDKADGNDFKPVCVAIHGGAWSAGTAEDFVGQSKFMANLGFKVFDIDYRLAPEARMSQQIGDCRTAVRHIRANAKKYGINPNRIIAMGHSAGGHLCCMLAVLKPGKWEGVGYTGVSSQIHGVLNLCGPEEIDWYYRNMQGTADSNLTGLFSSLVENQKGEPEAELRNISPIAYVSRASCPIFSIHGGADDVVPKIQGEDFHELLNKIGVRNELIILADEDHGLMVHGEDMMRECIRCANDFKNKTGIFAAALKK